MKKPIAAITENREIRMPNMMLNMPNRISPMIPTTKPPAQKAMFDVAVTTADNAFHNTFPMSLNIILIFSDFRLLITLFGFGVGCFFFFSPLCMSDVFLWRLPTALVVFVSGASQRLGSRISKFFRQNTTPERAWRFFDKKFEFLIPSLPLPQATKMTPDAVLDGGMETEADA